MHSKDKGRYGKVKYEYSSKVSEVFPGETQLPGRRDDFPSAGSSPP